MSSEVKWRFEEIKGIASVASGDMAKNLKNETQDVDGGLFENDHLSTVVRWFSREFIQNSIDATIEGVVPLIKFRFVSLTGAEKLEFVKSLGLGALLKRLPTMYPEAG